MNVVGLRKAFCEFQFNYRHYETFLKNVGREIIFRKTDFLWFVGEKLFSSLMCIPSVIFRHSKNVKKIRQYCPFVHLKNFTLLNR